MERGIAEGITAWLMMVGLGVLAALALGTVGILLGVLFGRVRALQNRVQALEEVVKRLENR
jgi:hypothetical protein